MKRVFTGEPDITTKDVTGKPGSFPTAEEGRRYGYEMGYGSPFEAYINDQVANIFGSRSPKYVTKEVVIKDKKGSYKQFQNEVVPGEGEFRAEGVMTGMRASDINSKPDQILDLTDPKNAKYKEVTQGLFAQAATAIGRNAIAQLGFNPPAMKLDVMTGENVNLKGLTRLEGDDKMYVNATSPSTIVHESIHNGMKKLRATPEGAKLFKKLDDLHGNAEEIAVRQIMMTVMGDPEKMSDDKAEAKHFFGPNSSRSKELKEALRDLEALAERTLGQRKGPR